MTDEELAAVRARVTDLATAYVNRADAAALLAEVDRLREGPGAAVLARAHFLYQHDPTRAHDDRHAFTNAMRAALAEAQVPPTPGQAAGRGR